MARCVHNEALYKSTFTLPYVTKAVAFGAIYI